VLAVDCPLVPLVEADHGESLEVAAFSGAGVGEAEFSRIDLVASNFFHGLPFGPDLIQQQGNRLFVVDQPAFSLQPGALHIFDLRSDGGLETVAQVELDLPVQQMIVQGDQVLLFGTLFDTPMILDAGLELLEANGGVRGFEQIAPFGGLAKTLVLTVNVGQTSVEVVRQEFEGVFHELHHQGDRVAMISSTAGDVVIAIYPPPPLTGQLTTFKITPQGLSTIAAAEIPLFGTTRVHGRDLYSAHTDHGGLLWTPLLEGLELNGAADSLPRFPGVPSPPSSSVSRNFLGDETIVAGSSLELGPGFLSHFDVAPDGRTAVAVRSLYTEEETLTSVDLLDLSGDEIRRYESIRLPKFSGQVLVGGPDYVVLRSYQDNTLVVIDANPAIDIAAENRVRRIALPDSLWVHYETLQVGSDRLVLFAQRDVAIEPTPRADGTVGLFAPERRGPAILLTVSISEARVIADSPLPEEVHLGSRQLILIDGPTQRFGFISQVAGESEARARFLFGRLLDNGRFDRDGAIGVGAWIEVDANAERLIVRQADRLLEYDWNRPEQPRVTPLGAPEPTIQAIPDHYRLHADGQDQLLDVLANDQIANFNFTPLARIVELIGAPEGAEIVEGRLVRIPAAALEGVEQLRFEYVIDNGQERSSAVVEIAVQSISEEQVRELVEAVRQRAAEDLNVAAEDIQITSVERLFSEPLPIVLPGDPTELNLSPGILVTLTAPNVTAMYAASLSGEIIQVFVSQLEFLVELGLRAVDDDGQTLAQVTEGQSFWLEFHAKDLRQFGLGVYAAFFDLVVPTEHLVITGPVEFQEGFTGIRGGEFDEGEIDDLGAIGNRIEATGNDQQSLLRIAVRAISAGQITLQPQPADASGTEALLRGRETEVPASRVLYTPTTLSIVATLGEHHLDADGNGDVTAGDALVVINFLGRYGTTDLERLAETVLGSTAEGEQVSPLRLEAMRRFDTSRNGTISALDALMVINGLGRQSLINEMAESEDDDTPLDPALLPPLDGLGQGRLF
jgi:hypothetical protein